MSRSLSSLLLLLAAAVAPAPARAADYVAWRAARITYVTSATAYVDAGSDDGLDEGQLLEVVRAGAVVATLRVTALSSHRAACEVQERGTQLVIGDTVRFVPRATPPAAQAPEPPAPGPPAPRAGSALAGSGLHGRIGVQYLLIRDRSADESGYSQPALDVRVDGTQVGGAPIDLAIDMRSRRTYQTLPDGSRAFDSTTGLYRFAAAWQERGSPWRVTLGRQLSPSFSPVSIFDGLEASYRSARWGTGMFAGTQPDPIDLGYNNDIHEYGGYVEWRNRPETDHRWTLTSGLVGSYTEGEVDREYMYLQGSFSDRHWSLWAIQEVDLNRSWKKDAEGESVTWTSTFLSAGYRLNDAWSFRAGYDNRRSVRLYRDLVTPVTAFDDQYRTGAWVGSSVRFAGHFSVGLDLRNATGGDLGGADAYTLSLGADRISRIDFDVRTRSTSYSNEQVDGWLHALMLGVPLGTRWHIGLEGGLRDETDLDDPTLDRQLHWYGLDVDVTLGRQWFAWISLERASEGDGSTDQMYASVAWRF